MCAQASEAARVREDLDAATRANADLTALTKSLEEQLATLRSSPASGWLRVAF